MQALDLRQLGLLFYVLLGLVFTVLIILIAYVVIANRRQRAELVEAYEVDRLSPRPALRVTGQILSIVRDQVGEPVKVEISGVKYRSLSEIENPVLRRQVLDAALELIQFTGVLGQDPAMPARLAEATNWREDVRERSEGKLKQIQADSAVPATQAPLAPVNEEVEDQFLRLLEDMGQTRQARERPSVAGSIQQRLTAKPTGPDQPRSFVDEIEDIVQRRIRLIPALIGRDLHIRLDHAESVCFTFEGKEYKNLEDVPNLTARQLVKDAIQEWEESP
jgi:hypothetical protein